MKNSFNCIAILGQPRDNNITTHKILYDFLKNLGHHVLIEPDIAKVLCISDDDTAPLTEIGSRADLGIVIGGDGNMLSTAKKLSGYKNIKLIGINRGKLGFLADLEPEISTTALYEILQGCYQQEQRFLLEVEVFNNEHEVVHKEYAVNEVILHSGQIAHMVSFNLFIDDQFAFNQRADGVIIATPTGSTAYALSAGGPILLPKLDAMTILPMLPHTLSAARPLVISSDSCVKLSFPIISNIFAEQDIIPQLICDGKINLPVSRNMCVIIRRSQFSFNLVHPKSYDYYKTLRSKLGWSISTN